MRLHLDPACFAVSIQLLYGINVFDGMQVVHVPSAILKTIQCKSIIVFLCQSKQAPIVALHFLPSNTQMNLFVPLCIEYTCFVFLTNL